MRLFLSSQDLGDYSNIAAEMAGDNKKLAFIRNAKDDEPYEQRDDTTFDKIRMFEVVGFSCEVLDLRDYFGKDKELDAYLADFGAIWCSGGNTFLLRRAMKATGLDKLLQRRLSEDSVMYGGWSAGACICAPSLHGVEHGDRPSPDVVPASYPIRETLWEGLNLVPFMVVPHCDQDWFKQDAIDTIAYLKLKSIDYIALNDGQVVIVNGDKVETLK